MRRVGLSGGELDTPELDDPSYAFVVVIDGAIIRSHHRGPLVG